jgi:putative flippase GtrA
MTNAPTPVPHKHKEVKRFLKFLVVGSTGFVVDFGVFNLLIRTVGIPDVPVYGVLIKGAIFAQAISFTLAATNNFLWNRYWTYPDSRTKPILRQFGQFFLLSVIGLFIRTPIFSLLNGPTKTIVDSAPYGPFAGLLDFAITGLHLTPDQIGNNAALAGAVLVVLFWNFFSNRVITYGDVKIGG